MEEMNLNDLQSVLDELKPKKEARMSEDFKAKVMKEARRQYGLEEPKRRVMGRYIQWSVAAMVALVCLIGVLTFQATPLSAQSLLEMAISNFKDVRTMVMDIDIRTRSQESFFYVTTYDEFINHSIRVRYDEPMRWRVEKSQGRTAFGEGDESCFWWPLYKVGYYKKGTPDSYLGYLSILLEPKEILQRELDNSLNAEGMEYSVKSEGDEIMLTVHSHLTEKERSYQVLLNRAIETSENIRKYIFDKKTKRLKNLMVYMVVNGKEVEVIRTNRIVYNVEVGIATLLELPSDVKIDSLRSIPLTAPSLENVSPEEAARIILQSMETWDETVLKQVFGPVYELFQKHFKGTKLIKVGTSFQEGHPHKYFIPYTIELPDGKVRDGNLSLHKKKDTWMFDGGL